MQNDSDFNVELNYQMILLRHLDRVSNLSVQVMGEKISEFTGIHSTEKYKIDAFIDSVMILESLIPMELKDNEYEKKLDEMIESYKKNMDDNENTDSQSVLYFKLWRFRFANCVNLLARKGYLYNRKDMVKSNKEVQEVFED